MQNRGKNPREILKILKTNAKLYGMMEIEKAGEVYSNGLNRLF